MTQWTQPWEYQITFYLYNIHHQLAAQCLSPFKSIKLQLPEDGQELCPKHVVAVINNK